GLLMINADAGVFLALEKGYFREQGLAVELNYFASSGGVQMAALTTGELDVGSGSISPGIYNGGARRVNMRIVAIKSRVGPQGLQIRPHSPKPVEQRLGDSCPGRL